MFEWLRGVEMYVALHMYQLLSYRAMYVRVSINSTQTFELIRAPYEQHYHVA